MAGNEFTYCKRLRASDSLALFEESGFEGCRKETRIDKEALKSVENGISIDEECCGYDTGNLWFIQLRVA